MHMPLVACVHTPTQKINEWGSNSEQGLLATGTKRTEEGVQIGVRNTWTESAKTHSKTLDK
jgi:hypothetical protein